MLVVTTTPPPRWSVTMADFDVAVVGAGRAGAAAAYRLASEGLSVVLLERATKPGMKNVTGGVLYGEVLADLVPEFPAEAPLERHVVEHNIQLLHDDAEVGISYRDPALSAEPNYTLQLGPFDRWFVEKAVEQGAVFVPETTVRDVTDTRDGVRVETDRNGGTLTCEAVVGADGVNTTVGRASGIREPVRNDDVALSVKQVVKLDRETINERFRLDGTEGAAYVFTGFPEGVPNVGYFVYTFRDSIGVGAVGGLETLRSVGGEGYGGTGTPLYSLLERFTELDVVRPLVRGETVQEYQGILVPEYGYGDLPKRQDGSVVLVGDAAGLVLNKGYTFRGLDYGIESGIVAADAAVECHADGRWEAFGRRYDDALADSYVLRDMRQHRHLSQFLENPRMYGAYPGIATATLERMFSTSADADGLTWRQAWRAFRASDARLLDAVRDSWRAFRSL
jgi:electron transfer flavoprotein-quinone oxidoreductase